MIIKLKKVKIKEEFLFKYLWIIVIMPKIMQFILLGMLLVFLLGFRREKKDVFFIGIMLFAMSHFISILINCIANIYNTSRVLAAINTATIWIIGAFFYDYYRRKKINIIEISKYMYRNMCILIIISIIGYFVYNFLGVSNFSMVGRNLILKDYLLGESSIRLVAFLEHSNLVSMFYYICFPISLIYVTSKNRKHIYIFYLVSIFPVFLCKSRTAILISTVITILSIISFINCKDNSIIYKKKIILFYIMMGLLFLSISFYGDFWSKIYSSINDLINGRSNSTFTRIKIYSSSIEAVLENNIFWGNGIKTMIGNYPLGSHSTYIGVIYKTGIIGFFFFFISIGYMLIYYIKLCIKNPKLRFIIFYYLTIFISISVLDIDGSNWLLVCWMSVFGVFRNEDNWKVIH